MTTPLAPQWLVDKVKAARSKVQKQLDNSVEYGHNTSITTAKIAVYNEILSMMSQAELADLSYKLRLKYK